MLEKAALLLPILPTVLTTLRHFNLGGILAIVVAMDGVASGLEILGISRRLIKIDRNNSFAAPR